MSSSPPSPTPPTAAGDIADGAASTDMSNAAGAGARHRRPNLASARVLRQTSPITQQQCVRLHERALYSAVGKVNDIILKTQRIQ